MEHMFTRRKTADVSALSSYGSCETKNKRCGSCILTTKLVTRTNYYDISSGYCIDNSFYGKKSYSQGKRFLKRLKKEKCHTVGREEQKGAKKCHLYFEWPLSRALLFQKSIGPKVFRKTQDVDAN
jgi:hypothetical protein